MEKRGQAAMEFLMTYGWAILAAIIVVGVLWYMIGNPANLAGDRFTVSAPFAPKGVNFDTTTAGTMSINVLNGAGSSVTVTAIDFTGTCADLTPGTDIPVGAEQSFTTTGCGASGDRVNSDVTITYSESGSTFDQTATGSVSGKIP